MKDVAEVAREHFAAGHNCAEAVLLAVAGALGEKSPLIPRLATGFGAGMGRCGEVCGALSGAVMALGLRFGRDNPQDADAKNLVYARAEQLLIDFDARFGDIRCLSLTGCDMRTPEGMLQAKDNNLHVTLCPQFVAFAAERVMEMILAEKE